MCLWPVYLQEEKDELARQLLETMEVEEANRRKIIVKFKARYVRRGICSQGVGDPNACGSHSVSATIVVVVVPRVAVAGGGKLVRLVF